MKKIIIIIIVAILLALSIRPTEPDTQAAFDSPLPLPSVSTSPLLHFPLLYGSNKRPDPSDYLKPPSTRE